MIVLYPDRHVRALNIGALVQRALRGELYLLLEDGQVVKQITQLHRGCTEFVGQLEPATALSTDVILACLVMAVDCQHDTIGAMEPQAGFILYCMLVYVLAVEVRAEAESEAGAEAGAEAVVGPEEDEESEAGAEAGAEAEPFQDLGPVAAEVAASLSSETMMDVYQAVKAASDRLLGGIPRNIRLLDVKNLTERVIARRTGLTAAQHMAFYNFIEREKVMAQRISEAAAAHPALDVHVVLGACHVTGNLSEEFINTLNVNVPSYADLNNLIEQHYPGQRLVNLIGEHEVR